MVCCGLAWGTHRCWVPTELSVTGISRSSRGATLLDGLSATCPVPVPRVGQCQVGASVLGSFPRYPPQVPCPRWPRRGPGAEAVSRGAPCWPGRSWDYRHCATCWPCTFLLRASGTVPWHGQGPDVALGIAAPQDLSDDLLREQGASPPGTNVFSAQCFRTLCLLLPFLTCRAAQRSPACFGHAVLGKVFLRVFCPSAA